jgi:hypothetical protein
MIIVAYWLLGNIGVDAISHSLAGIYIPIAYVISRLAVVLPILIALFVHVGVAKVSFINA